MEFKNIDIKDHYVVSLLGGDSPGDACLGVTKIASWTDKNKTVYLCLDQDIKTYITENIGDILNGNYITKGEYDLNISSIDERLNKLEEYHSFDLKKNLLSSDGVYIAKGENPNNWVEFEVSTDTSLDPYFMEASNMWRIMAINEQGKIELIYSSLAFSSSGWDRTVIESYTETDNSNKLNVLYNNILNKTWVIKSNYLIDYRVNYGDNYGILIEYINPKLLPVGTFNIYDYYESLLLNESYLYESNTLFLGMTYNSAYDQNRNAVFYYGYQFGQIKSSLSYFKPAIILNSNVKLIENNTSTCTGDKIQGTEECPYRLECSEC